MAELKREAAQTEKKSGAEWKRLEEQKVHVQICIHMQGLNY